MKKVLLSVIVATSFMYATDNTKQDCVEDFQSEILNILNDDKPKSEKEKALSEINKNIVEECDPLPLKKDKALPGKSDMGVEDCIEEFENDIMKIISNESETEKKKKAIEDAYKLYENNCEKKY